MTRVKRAMQHLKKRRILHRRVKGYRGGRKNLIRAAKTAVNKAGAHAYVGRKQKKRNYRALWQTRIGAAAREQGLSYSRLIDLLKKQKVELDRKVLAQLAAEYPAVFAALVKAVKK